MQRKPDGEQKSVDIWEGQGVDIWDPVRYPFSKLLNPDQESKADQKKRLEAEKKAEKRKEEAELRDHYQDAARTLEKHEKSLYAQFHKMLDPVVYQTAIWGGKVEKISQYGKTYERYVVAEQNSKDPIYYYQHLLNLLKDTQVFLEAVSRVHQKALKLTKAGLWKRATSVNQLNGEVTLVLEAYSRLYSTIDALNLDQRILELFSLEEMFKTVQQVTQMVLPVQAFLAEAARNPVLSMLEGHAEALKRAIAEKPEMPLPDPKAKNKNKKKVRTGALVDLSENLLNLEQVLNSMLLEFTSIEHSRESLQSIERAKSAVHRMLERIKKYTLSSRSFSETISLVKDLYPLSTEFRKHFPQSYAALSKSTQTNLLQAAHQFNQVFRELFLRLDRLEARYYLRDKYLFALGTIQERDIDKPLIQLAQNFNSWLESLNYEFKQEERFPYAQVLLAQRERVAKRQQKSLTTSSLRRQSELSAKALKAKEDKNPEQARYYEGMVKQVREMDGLRQGFMQRRLASGNAALKQQEKEKARRETEKNREFLRYEGYELQLCYGEKVKLYPEEMVPATIYLYLENNGLKAAVKKGNQLEEVVLEGYRLKVNYGQVRLRIEPEAETPKWKNLDDAVQAKKPSQPSEVMQPKRLYLYLEDDELCLAVREGKTVENLSLDKLSDEQRKALCNLLKDDQLKTPLLEQQAEELYKLAAEQGYYTEAGLSEQVVESLIMKLKDPAEPPLLEAQTKAIYEQSSKLGYLPLTYKKKLMLERIDRRIAELEKERKAAWLLLTKTKQKKEALLRQLKTMLDKSLEEVGGFNAEILKGKLKSFANPELLFEGRTGKMLQGFRDLTYKREDEANLIDKFLKKLDERQKAGFWFFAAYRSRQLAQHIAALKLLRQWLTTPGYRVDEALEMIKLGHLKKYKKLLSEDRKLLNELRVIEKQLAQSQIGMRLVKPLFFANPAQVKTKTQLIDDHQALLRAKEQQNKHKDPKRLQRRLEALEQLKLWLNKSGYQLNNSFQALEISNPEALQVLRAETVLLAELRAQENPPKGSRLLAKVKYLSECQQSLKAQMEQITGNTVSDEDKKKDYLARIAALKFLTLLLGTKDAKVQYLNEGWKALALQEAQLSADKTPDNEAKKKACLERRATLNLVTSMLAPVHSVDWALSVLEVEDPAAYSCLTRKEDYCLKNIREIETAPGSVRSREKMQYLDECLESLKKLRDGVTGITLEVAKKREVYNGRIAALEVLKEKLASAPSLDWALGVLKKQDPKNYALLKNESKFLKDIQELETAVHPKAQRVLAVK